MPEISSGPLCAHIQESVPTQTHTHICISLSFHAHIHKEKEQTQSHEDSGGAQSHKPLWL